VSQPAAARPEAGTWQVHGERTVYSSDRIDVVLVDVEEPDGRRVPEHHVVRCHFPAAGCLVASEERGLLLIRRHRFITDSWGWEVPGGGIEPGESPVAAARRELEEETGWAAVGPLTPLVRYHPMTGLLRQTFSIHLARDARQVGPPASAEAAEVAWLPESEVERQLDAGEITDGFSLTALLAWSRLSRR
jgi:8-oxo-dGTP pyrophosphatase MutT (NUDIX family)